MQLLPVKTWVIQLSQPDPSAWMKGMEILTSPWCILILAIVQPTEIMTSFTIGPTCAYYSSPFQVEISLDVALGRLKASPPGKPRVPSGLNATQLCAAKAFQKILELFPFGFFEGIGKEKTQLGDWFESVICFVVPAEVIRVVESVLTERLSNKSLLRRCLFPWFSGRSVRSNEKLVGTWTRATTIGSLEMYLYKVYTMQTRPWESCDLTISFDRAQVANTNW